jgi:hypothetical protein
MDENIAHPRKQAEARRIATAAYAPICGSILLHQNLRVLKVNEPFTAATPLRKI